jgi:S1-C subfamily serine protease
VVEVVAGGPGERAGLRSGDVMLTVGGVQVSDAQSLQRLLFGEAIGVRLPITVLRKGAKVDVFAVPNELSEDPRPRR